MTRQHTMQIAVALAIVASAACGNTMRGIKTDTENAAEKTAAGVETMDVKARSLLWPRGRPEHQR